MFTSLLFCSMFLFRNFCSMLLEKELRAKGEKELSEEE